MLRQTYTGFRRFQLERILRDGLHSVYTYAALHRLMGDELDNGK